MVPNRHPTVNSFGIRALTYTLRTPSSLEVVCKSGRLMCVCKRGVVGCLRAGCDRDGSSCNGERDKGVLGSLRMGIGGQALEQELR